MQSDFYTFLKTRLTKPLPGPASQMKMAAKPAGEGAVERQTAAPEGAHPSSVLALLFPGRDQRLELLLTQRTRHINHGGELSLPGGRAETGESVVETALREAREEVGIKYKEVEIAGRLSDLYVAHSNNNIRPVIGFLADEPDITINPNEVEEAFSIPLSILLDDKRLTVERWTLHNACYNVPYWNVHEVPLWGATAMILSELADIYREFLSS